MTRNEISKAARYLAGDYLDMLEELRATDPDATPAKIDEHGDLCTEWIAYTMGAARFDLWLRRVRWSTVEQRKAQVMDAARAHLLADARNDDRALDLLTWATRTA